MIYQWKTINYKVEAEDAGRVFEELEQTVGLTPKNLVEASRDENAPLHNEFEWDDDVAAEKYREQQARVMICNLTIKADNHEPVRAFVSLSTDERKYESITVILADRTKTNMLFDMALKELNSFKKKYADIQEFADLFAEIDRLSA